MPRGTHGWGLGTPHVTPSHQPALRIKMFGGCPRTLPAADVSSSRKPSLPSPGLAGRATFSTVCSPVLGCSTALGEGGSFPLCALSFSGEGTQVSVCSWSSTDSFTHSLTNAFIHSVTHSCIHSLTHSLTHSLMHSFTQSLIHAFIRSLTHSLVHLGSDRHIGRLYWG